jgi:hypothetical protein
LKGKGRKNYHVVHLEPASGDEQCSAGIVASHSAGVRGVYELSIVVSGIGAGVCGAFEGYVVLGDGKFLFIRAGIHVDGVSCCSGIVCCCDLIAVRKTNGMVVG